MIANQLMVIGTLPAWVAGIVVVVVTSLTTEITSNTVITTLLLPIMAQVVSSPVSWGLGLERQTGSHLPYPANFT